MIRVPLFRTVLMVLGALGFVLAGSLILFAAASGLYEVFRAGRSALVIVFSLVNVTLYAAVGVVAILFFGYALVFLFIRLASSLFGEGILLEFRPDGILDRASAVGVGFVPWKNVRRIRFEYFYGQNFMVIKVANSEELLARLNPFKRAIVRLNRRYYTGGEVSIPTSQIGTTEEELTRELQVWRERFEVRR